MSPASLLTVSGMSWPGVAYGCTTRAGGVSTGPWASMNLGLHVGDDPQAVLQNRRRLAAGLPGEPVWLEQVHGIELIEAREGGSLHRVEGAGTAGPGSPLSRQMPPRADAAITLCRGVVLAIMTADCLPIVIADTEGRALGVAHAGWRGLAAGVLEATLAALMARRPHAAGWRAWIGPGISQAAFEVGSDVRSVFVDTNPSAAAFFLPGRQPGKWQADLAGLACHRLETMGVYGVELSGLCTWTRGDLFHSYRRDTTCGRMATLAWLR